MPQYLWLVVVGCFAAFAFGYGTGSNDVANAFATSVGAKTLTLKQAVVIAIIFNFTGALVLGRVVTSVIAGSIAKPEVFNSEPEIYAYGMVVALAVGFFWQIGASYLGYNVSATHSIIGAIMGFALVYDGVNAVNWAKPDPKRIPPYTGVVPIVCAWFVAPVLTAAGAILIFLTVRTFVLRRKNALALSYWALPPFVIITIFINVYFVFTRGAAKSLEATGDWDDNKAAWVAACVAAGAGLLVAVIVLPILRRMSAKHWAGVAAKEQQDKADAEAAEAAAAEAAANPPALPTAAELTSIDAEKAGAVDANGQPLTASKGKATFGASMKKFYGTTKELALRGVNTDIHDVVQDDPFIAALHERAEKFDPRVEWVFGYLQVFSAICVIFSHGAGEVGYMAGPLATVWEVYKTGTLPDKVSAPIWIVLIGALGLVFGLATYGYNVCRTMGTAMAKLSPSRGFAAELSTAMIIMVAAQAGLPTSSSQCITGAILGVGMLEGVRKGVNWKLFARQFGSWVLTLIAVAGITGAVFAQGVYTPSKISGRQVEGYKLIMGRQTAALLNNYNQTLQQAYPLSQVSPPPINGLSASAWAEANATVESLATRVGDLFDPKMPQSTAVSPDSVGQMLDEAIMLNTNNSIFTLGQENVVAGARLCNPTTKALLVAPNAEVKCPPIKYEPNPNWSDERILRGRYKAEKKA
jgi:solute carrier family 20 (sodium-dependent phosphate transporter)